MTLLRIIIRNRHRSVLPEWKVPQMAASTARSPRKRGRPTADERVQRRAQILDAALPVFLRYGFARATVDELAAAAHVTKRTIYSYFGDKAGVFADMVRSLATTVSSDAPDDDTLESLASRIIFRVHSDELVGLHRLVIAESARFPELAVTLHDNGDARHIARLTEHITLEHPQIDADVAANRAVTLFSLLLGEAHRRRLLGLTRPPTREQATQAARSAIDAAGLASSGPSAADAGTLVETSSRGAR
jgi:AcrR family transcriptional regulator